MFKGDPHDLIVFDEGTDFLESQYRFIIGWNRSTDPKQRCRVIVASNPPTTPEGLWVVKYWGPWLDTTHSNPAEPGELRWFTIVGGEDREVDGPGPHMIEGEAVYARSRNIHPGDPVRQPRPRPDELCFRPGESPGRIASRLSRWRFLSRHSRC